MANESFFSESRELGGGSFSIDDLLGCENVGSEQAEESVFNIDRVGDIDSDDSEPILRFKRTKLTLKPAKTPYPRHFKTTTSPSIPLNVPLPRSKTRSLGPPIILPLPDDTIEIQGKRKQSSSTSVKTAPPKHPRNQPQNLPASRKPQNRCPNRLQSLMNPRKRMLGKTCDLPRSCLLYTSPSPRD